MALLPCSECGREISDKAAACPQCGAPVEQSKTAEQSKTGEQWAYGVASDRLWRSRREK